jgi:hypothetical protein
MKDTTRLLVTAHACHTAWQHQQKDAAGTAGAALAASLAAQLRSLQHLLAELLNEG